MAKIVGSMIVIGSRNNQLNIWIPSFVKGAVSQLVGKNIIRGPFLHWTSREVIGLRW
jgi:hypothetical protein